MSRVKKTDEYTRQIFSVFKKRGLNISMDCIAKELGITKKTLYNNYTSREDLYAAVTTYFYDMLEKKIREDIESERNCISQMLMIAKIVSSEIKKLGEKFLLDVSQIESIFPLLHHAHRSSFYSVIVKENLTKGIKAGFYRDDLNESAVTLFYTSLIDAFYKWDGEFKYLFEYEDYFYELVKYHLYSLTNSVGRKQLEELLILREK